MLSAEKAFLEFLKEGMEMETNEDQPVQEKAPVTPDEAAIMHGRDVDVTKPSDFVRQEVLKDRDQFLRRLFDHEPSKKNQEKAAPAPSNTLLDRVRGITGRP